MIIIILSNYQWCPLPFQHHHSNLFCGITLYLATTIDLQLRSILDLCKIGPWSCSGPVNIFSNKPFVFGHLDSPPKLEPWSVSTHNYLCSATFGRWKVTIITTNSNLNHCVSIEFPWVGNNAVLNKRMNFVISNLCNFLGK